MVGGSCVRSQTAPAEVHLVRTAAIVLCGILGAALAFASCAPPRVPAAAGPSASLKTEAWDFGTIRRGETARTAIELANPGTDTLRATFSPSCDCLKTAPESAFVPPGKSAIVSLSFLGYEIKDATTKTLFIDTNDPVKPRIALTVRGRVVQGTGPDIVILPNPLPAYGAPGAAPTEPRRGDLTVRNAGREDLIVKEVRCFGCIADPTALALPPASEAVLKISTIPGWQDGRWIELESNDPLFPTKRISIVDMQ
jgi:hypothetical protein